MLNNRSHTRKTTYISYDPIYMNVQKRQSQVTEQQFLFGVRVGTTTKFKKIGGGGAGGVMELF